MFRPNLKLIKVFRMGLAYATRQLKDIDISSGLVYFIVELSQVRMAEHVRSERRGGGG